MTSQLKQPFPVSAITNPKFQVYSAIVSLCLVIVYCASVYIYRPYDDLVWDQARVVSVGEIRAKDAGFQVGDLVLAIDDIPVIDTLNQRPLYKPFVGAGDQVTYKIQRGEQTLIIPMTMGSYLDRPDFLAQLLIDLFLAVCFWALGLVLTLFAPPADTRARLIGYSWLLFSVALATGMMGDVSWFWGHGIIMKICFSLLFFVYIAQHLYFPTPSFTSEKRNWIIRFTAAISIVLIVSILIDDLYIKPRLNVLSSLNRFVYICFLASVVTSVFLLIYNHFKASDPDVKRQTGIVFAGTVLGFAPFVVLHLIPLLLPIFSPVHVIYTLPFFLMVPLSYAYVIYQRKLLKIDWIVNRLVVLFVVILLILFLSVSILGFLTSWLNLSPQLPLLGGLFTAVFFVCASGLEKRVQVRVDHILYGTHYDHSLVTSSLSRRLVRTLDRQALTHLLTGSFSEQMGIRQSALLLAKDGQLFLQSDTDKFSAKVSDKLCATLVEARRPMRAQNLWGLLPEATQADWQPFDWGEVFAPLIFRSQLQGILVLGERTANDLYSEQDVGIIATVADQATLAFANIQYVEELNGLAQKFIRSEEEQRYKISQDLHDAVLQNLCVVKIGVTDPVLKKHLDDMMDKIRIAIKNQRPRTLNQGIVDALEDLVEDMRKILPQGTIIIWRNYIDDPLQMSDELVTHVYRIAYEAILNAVKHARAHAIRVSIEKIQDKLRVSVEDDGVGMADCKSPMHHYGLSGMSFRAQMVNAHLDISSTPGEGTEIALETTICP